MTTDKVYDRVEDLFDLLVNNSVGLTRQEIREETDWSEKQLSRAIQLLRDMLARNNDSITVIAEPQGQGQPWLYSLTAGNIAGDPEQSKNRWIVSRFRDALRRLQTISSVLKVVVKATDGRTSIGKKARIYHLHLTRAAEEIALVDNEDGLVKP